MVDKWQDSFKDDSFHFRQYADATVQQVTASKCLSPDSCEEEDSEENDQDVKIVTPLSRQKLLFVHQTAWQKQLLSRYGNDICLLDATYKTTCYALLLYFLTVRTNVDYQIVGSFVVQDESTESIKEALGALHQWNLKWRPAFFMVDCCEEEINAIESTFPGMWSPTKSSDSLSGMLQVLVEEYLPDKYNR